MRSLTCTVFILGMLGGSLLALQPLPSAARAVPANVYLLQQPEQSAAQTPNEAPPANLSTSQAGANTNTLRVASDSVIPAELTRSIDAKKAKQGDEVVAKVTQDLVGNNGQVLVPKDTQVTGHITEARASTKEEKHSELGITFEKLQTKKGETATLPMSIQAIIAPRNPAADSAGTAGPAPGGEPNGMPSGNNGPNGRYNPMEGPPPASQTSTGNASPRTPDNAPRGPITVKTEGVIGIPNLKLSAPSDLSKGSLVVSDKGNVKIDSGTILLLRVK